MRIKNEGVPNIFNLIHPHVYLLFFGQLEFLYPDIFLSIVEINNTGFVRNIQFLDRTNDTIIVAHHPVPDFKLIDIVKCERVVGKCCYTVNISVLSHFFLICRLLPTMSKTDYVFSPIQPKIICLPRYCTECNRNTQIRGL